jgi:uncharacterized protein YkwD
MGIAPYLNPEAYADVQARSDAYLYATDGSAEAGPPPAGRTVDFPSDGFAEVPRSPGSHRRRKKKAAAPVRTGLLGVSAAVALGAIAVATGVVPGLDDYRIGGGGTGSDSVQSADAPSNTPSEQGGTAGSAESGVPGTAGTSTGRSPSPSASAGTPSDAASAPAESPSKEKDKKEKAKQPKKPSATPGERRKAGGSPSRAATEQPARPADPPVAAASGQAAVEAEVLRLVNAERAKVGCTPVTADRALAELAESFSEAMAAQGFFDHTDPSGATPWDRAEAAGISNLGGENIARGQADAQAVMDAWMNSEGHRANILNCDFATLGVGVHFGSGGPWWTQDFGY